jgi:hypothetical protein
MTALQSEKLKKEKSTAKLFYAIMEIEAWVLGMSDVPERLDVIRLIPRQLSFILPGY